MAQYTGSIHITYEVTLADQFSLNGRTVVYWPATMKCTGADRYNAQTWELSAGLSAQVITLAPFGISAPGDMLFFLADHPVDLRFNAASDVTFVSAVQMMTLGATISNFFITTSAATVIHLEMVGGSNATLTATLPLP